jgi:hypothetical protein
MAKPKTEDLSARVAALRAEIAARQAEAVTITAAPVPLDEVERHLTELVDQLAASADVDEPLLAFARDPEPRLDAVSRLLGDPRFDVGGYRAAVVAVHREALLAAWLPRLRRLYETDPRLAAPIPLAERPARLAQLQQRIHALALEEELAIVEGERHGVRIDRRADARPEIIFDPTVLEATAPPAA